MAVFDLAHEERLVLCATPRRLNKRVGEEDENMRGPDAHEHLGA